MNGELIWVLSLLAVAVVLFASGKVRMDAIALLVIVAFVLSDTLTLSEAFCGVWVWAGTHLESIEAARAAFDARS